MYIKAFRIAFFCFFSVLAAACTPGPQSIPQTIANDPLTLDASIHVPSGKTITEASGQTHVAKDFTFAPIHALKLELDDRLGQTLLDRGEGHVTLVTPPEFAILSLQVPRDEMLQLAEDSGLNDDDFNVVCLGRGQIVTEGETLSAYFLVLEQPSLLTYRNELYTRYVARGGDATLFDPSRFYPHVTVAFTKRDLHVEDGVIKDASACLYAVTH